ncbi:MAG: MerR family transcriptional regulator [Desulfobulbaceae bacterium]|jgi:DNA-binding transcriptional MerR regulator|nr:MerR family transcriptional regulator [Desulfobulbaceae bacterium]
MTDAFGHGFINADIPDKTYFKIGEVCKLTGLKQHVVRYWESEFKQFIRPKRAGSKQRLYRRGDVEYFFRLQKLLKDDGLTIAGAKKFLAGNRDCLPIQAVPGPEKSPQADDPRLSEIKQDLQSLLDLLERTKGA